MMQLIMFVALLAYLVYEDRQKVARRGYRRPWWSR